MANLPSFQFYPGDWLRDNVAGCSIAAQGLWLRMMILAHDCEPYGVLERNGKTIPNDVIARQCGCDPEEFERLFKELEDAGVPSRTRTGSIYSRRMVRDAQTRKTMSNKRSLAGLSGNKKRWGESQSDRTCDNLRSVCDSVCDDKTSQSDRSSSSSSSSYSYSNINTTLTGGIYRPPKNSVEGNYSNRSEILARFEQSYIAKTNKNIILTSEDTVKSQELVRVYGSDDVLNAIDRYFSEADEFVMKKGYPFYLFYKLIPQFIAGNVKESGLSAFRRKAEEEAREQKRVS